jgi:osmoprotectant transport system permease protein
VIPLSDAGDFLGGLEFVVENAGLILDKTVEHLALSGSAIAIAIAIAIPIGVWLGHLHRGSFLAINVGNVGRALPSLALLAFGLPFFGISFTNVLVALVVLAVPPMLTNAYTGVDGVDHDAVEAARGMGMSPAQIIRKVELPLALPLIFAGIRTSSVYVVATATIAAIAGGGGLGDIIVNQASYRIEGVIGAALCVSALAFAVDFALAGAQRLFTPPALRGSLPSIEPDLAPRAGR